MNEEKNNKSKTANNKRKTTSTSTKKGVAKSSNRTSNNTTKKGTNAKRTTSTNKKTSTASTKKSPTKKQNKTVSANKEQTIKKEVVKEVTKKPHKTEIIKEVSKKTPSVKLKEDINSKQEEVIKPNIEETIKEELLTAKVETKNERNTKIIDDKPKKEKHKINRIFYFIFLIIYLELITKIYIYNNVSNIVYTIIFSIPVIILLYLLSNIFKQKGNKITTYFITSLFCFYYGFQCIFHKLYSIIFSFNTISLATGLTEFKGMILDIIIDNIIIIITYLIPLILLIVLHKRIKYDRDSKNKIIISETAFIVTFLLSLLSLLPKKEEIYSAYNLYYNTNSEIKTVEKFGLATYTRLDIKRVIFGFEEALTVEKPYQDPEEETPSPKPVSYNELQINFQDLIDNESNNTIKNILSYFKSSEPTNKNEYTGIFKGKNVIFILAEGFNMIAVDENLTPTLYKLTHEGFVFNNFYSPVFLSTTGGEFQATTGLIPTQEVLSNWKKNMPTIKYALGHSFSNLGYNVSSYHNWTYTYYARQKTMPTLGFTNYTGCGNGLEKEISCKWLPSDIDLINATLPKYKDYEKFATYYVSVSGHAPYAYNSTGNSIALKNIDLVKDLPYSDNVKAYLATQIEFDRALETLINSLEAEGILKDTVISFVGDHYPYTLTTDEINELSTYNRDEIVEVNRSNFVIWNSEMKTPITVDKVGSQIDVLPTILNLFGIEYDSRLIVGKDILSDTPGLAIFSDRSWVSDYGTYSYGKFTLKEGKNLDNEQEYINQINNIVANRFAISNQIIKYNLYDYILK